MSNRLGVRLLSQHASVPTRASADAAGYDLTTAHSCVVVRGGRALVSTDVALCLPPSTYGRIAPRSGMALRNGITTGAGVIDRDYTGNVGVLLFNHDSHTDYHVTQGDRIAQLVVECISTPDVYVIHECDTSADSSGARGASGFGSTGGCWTGESNMS
jgi:dUTP pyrophosphatase